MSERFDGNFTQQEPLSAEAIDAAVRVMQSGRLHRYNVLPDEIGEVVMGLQSSKVEVFSPP